MVLKRLWSRCYRAPGLGQGNGLVAEYLCPAFDLGIRTSRGCFFVAKPIAAEPISFDIADPVCFIEPKAAARGSHRVSRRGLPATVRPYQCCIRLFLRFFPRLLGCVKTVQVKTST